jgi:hypothetical protein
LKKEVCYMYYLGYLLALLATVVVGWALPILGVAVLLPLLQIVYTLQPSVAAGVMGLLGGLLFYYSISRQAWWQAIVWGALWGVGALAAALGWLNWYALLIEGILLAILLVAEVVAPAWAGLLRWFAAGELALTLLLIWGQWAGVPGETLVFGLLLVTLASLVGAGAYRPFEARHFRRMAAGLATLAAVVLILWQPVIVPAGHWLWQAASQVGRAAGEAVAASPLGRWYRVASLRWERTELGETSKTEALRQLHSDLTRAHKARWEKSIEGVPNLPLAREEWGDLGIPQQADP